MKQKVSRTRQKKEPWRTMALISCASEDWILTTTFIDISDRKDLITKMTIPEILWAYQNMKGRKIILTSH